MSKLSLHPSVVQSPSHVWLCKAWTATCHASLSLTISASVPKFIFSTSVMPGSPLIFWCPLLLLSSIFPSIGDFSNKLFVRMMWPKYWSFSISSSSEYSGLISLRIDWFDLLAVQELSIVFSNTAVQRHQFFRAQPFLLSSSYIHTWLLEKS